MFGKFHRFTLWESIERFESFHAKCHIVYSNKELNDLIDAYDAYDAYDAGETNFNSLLKATPAPMIVGTISPLLGGSIMPLIVD
ncbi:hypothetical protein ACNSPD_04005 [Yersinia enterocolitica]|uniref:hypothetical protein n=1 Tax=Yersinia TaxID=629 RepID=UPI003AB2F77D